MKFLVLWFVFAVLLLQPRSIQAQHVFYVGPTEATISSSEVTSSPTGSSYVVLGTTQQEEAVVRAQIRIMQPGVLPSRVVFVPHWKYVDDLRIFRLHVPTGYMSLMFTHLPSRTVFIDADRYISNDSLGYRMAHELGHLETNSTKEEDAEKAAAYFRRRLKNATSVHTGLGLGETLSQQMQDPKDFQTPRTGISPSELSDLRWRAEEGDGKAQFLLGRIYMAGLVVSQDYQQAAKWYERAAKQGLAEAQFRMGFLYEQGKGVPRDYTRAVEYYRAAADQGHGTAANNLASLYLHGLGAPKNIGTALKWLQFSAEHGDAVGQCNLGTFYFDGKAVPKDYKEAARWFRAAAEQGFPAAENNLAFLYFTGEGVVQDYGEAFEWMSRAAEQGYARAQINLGDLYIEGKGAPLDYVTAYMWYSLGSAGDRRATTKIKNLSHLITPKQRVEGENRASAWLSSHRNLVVNE